MSDAKVHNAKRYLQRIRNLDNELSLLSTEYGQLEKDLTGVRAVDYSKAKITGGEGSDLSRIIAKMEECISKLDNKWDELINLRREAEELISKIGDERYRHVLYRRYILNSEWENIAVDMKYTYHAVHKLHYVALEIFERILKTST